MHAILNITDYFDGPVEPLDLRGRRKDFNWDFRRIRLPARFVATQKTLSDAVVCLYIVNPFARTPYSRLRDIHPILTEHAERLVIQDGHHHIAAAMKRGDAFVDVWVGQHIHESTVPFIDAPHDDPVAQTV